MVVTMETPTLLPMLRSRLNKGVAFPSFSVAMVAKVSVVRGTKMRPHRDSLPKLRPPEIAGTDAQVCVSHGPCGPSANEQARGDKRPSVELRQERADDDNRQQGTNAPGHGGNACLHRWVSPHGLKEQRDDDS